MAWVVGAAVGQVTRVGGAGRVYDCRWRLLALRPA